MQPKHNTIKRYGTRRYLLDDGRPDFPNIIMISKLELTWLNSYQAMFIVVLLVTQTRPNKFTNPCEI